MSLDPRAGGRGAIAVAGAEGGAYGIAAGMAQSIAVNVLSDQAINLTDPIFEALGIGSADSDNKKYFEQMMAGITAIEGDIGKLSTKLSSVSTQISAIQRAITAISSEIKDAELQQQLSQYIQNVNIVEQNYQSYAAALAALAKEDTREAGADALFDLFQTVNADAVGIAMRNLRDLLVGAGELRGILSYQADEFAALLNSKAADPAWTTTLTYPGTVDPFGTPKNMSEWGWAFPDGSQILVKLPEVIESSFDDTITPTLVAIAAIQLKGLSFLCAAWGGTPNESSLATYSQALADIVAAMRGLFASIDFDAIAAAAIQQNGVRVTPDQRNQDWSLDPNPPGPPPIDDNWIFWSLGAEDPAAPLSFFNQVAAGLAQAPWNYGSVASASVVELGNASAEKPDGSFELTSFGMGPTHPIHIPRPSQAGLTPPTGLARFLAALPGA